MSQQFRRQWVSFLLLSAVLCGCVSPYFRRLEMIDAAWEGDLMDMRRHVRWEPQKIDGITEATDNFASLHAAAQEGHLKVVSFLVRKGARIDMYGSGGVYPIHCAARRGHLDVVNFFLRKGMDIDEAGADGTSLHYAVKNDHVELAEYLLQLGADISLSIFNAPTPLHVAAREGHVESVRLLLEYGADPNALDVRDRTPHDLAVAGQHEAAAKALLDATDESHIDPVRIQ